MLQIKKGNFIIKVTPGAYKAYYKGLGFSPLFEPVRPSEGLNPPTQQFTQGLPQKAHTEALKPLSEALEEDLNQMSEEELYEYANLLGLDLSGISSLEELKNLIEENPEGV